MISTIFPPGDVPLARRLEWSRAVERAVEEVNADIRSLASDHVIVLDAWQILQENGRLRSGYGIDTLHLSKSGYAALEPELVKALGNASR